MFVPKLLEFPDYIGVHGLANFNTNVCHNPNCRFSGLIIFWKQSLILKNLFISKSKLILLKNTPRYHDGQWLRSVCMVPTTEWCQLHWMGNVDGGWVDRKGAVGASFCGVGYQWQNWTGSGKQVGKSSHKEKHEENEWGKSKNDHEGQNVAAGSHAQVGSNGVIWEKLVVTQWAWELVMQLAKCQKFLKGSQGEWQIDYGVD